MHILTFFIAWKSKYWYLWFFMVCGAKPCCFPHVFWHKYAVFICVSMFFDSNLPTTPSVNWKMCLVFGLWLQKMRKHIINHTCMELSGTQYCHIHVRSDFFLRHKKAQLAFYNVVLRGWQLRMHTYTNKVRIQRKPGSLPVAAHWIFADEFVLKVGGVDGSF